MRTSAGGCPIYAGPACEMRDGKALEHSERRVNILSVRLCLKIDLNNELFILR